MVGYKLQESPIELGRCFLDSLPWDVKLTMCGMFLRHLLIIFLFSCGPLELASFKGTSVWNPMCGTG